MKTIKSNKEDLFFCHLGNGVSVCDRLRKENGDYIEVAHISYERAIIYYNSISDESREIIERFALEEIKEIELNKLRKEARKKYSSFGWREKNVLQGINLKLNLCCFRGSTPVYWVLSDNGSFEYYITREINVVG